MADREKDDDGLTGDEAILKEAREAFELAAEHEADNRAEALDDIRFARLAEQWPTEVRKQRETDGRPCLTVNKLPAFIRQVVNDARQNKPAIKVSPEDSQADPHTAELFTGLIRNIERSSDADTVYDIALDSAVTGGFGYFKVNTEYAYDDSFDQNVVLEPVSNPFSVFGDPYSQRWDSADWNTAFVVDMIPKDDFERKYKDAEIVDWDADGYVGLGAPWFDDDRVMVAQYWKRTETTKEIIALSNGEIVDVKDLEANPKVFAGLEVVGKPRTVRSHKVTQYLLTGCEVLETIEWAGKYIPIVPVYGDEVNVEGKRHFRSLIRDAKDPQRRFNYHQTVITESLALAPKTPFIGPKGAFETDAGKWETANSGSHAYIEYDGATPPARQAFAGIPPGDMQALLSASDDIKAVTGLYNASLGAQSNETSGVAINARKIEGDTSNFHFIDNLSRAIRHGGRILIDLIPKVYNTERMIRVLGVDGTPSNMPLKRPVRVDDKGQAIADPQLKPDGTLPGVERVFDLGAGRYDLTVDAGPSFTSRRQEAAAQMQELIRAFPEAAPILGDIYAKNLDWPEHEEIARRLKLMLPPQLQEGAEDGPDPNHPAVAQLAQAGAVVQQAQAQTQQVAQQAQQLQQELQAAKQALRAEQANKALETRKLDIAQFQAETARMTAMAKAQEPDLYPQTGGYA